MSTDDINTSDAIKIGNLVAIKSRLVLATQQYLSHVKPSGHEDLSAINLVQQFYWCAISLENKAQFIALICALLKHAPRDFSLNVIHYIYSGPMVQQVTIVEHVNHGTLSAPQYADEWCNTLDFASKLGQQFPSPKRYPQISLSPLEVSENVNELPFYDRDITSYRVRWQDNKINLRQTNKLALFKQVFYKALEASETSRDQSIYRDFCQYEQTFFEPAEDVSFSRKLSISDSALISALENAANQYLHKFQRATYRHAFGIRRARWLLHILSELKAAPDREQLMSLTAAVMQLSSGQLPEFLAKELLQRTIPSHRIAYDYHIPPGFNDSNELSLAFFYQDWYGPDHSFTKVTSRYFSIEWTDTTLIFLQGRLANSIQTLVPLELNEHNQLVLAATGYKDLAFALLNLIDGFENTLSSADMHTYTDRLQRGETPLRLFFSIPPRIDMGSQHLIEYNTMP